MPDFKDEPLEPVDLSVEHMTPDESDEFDYSDYIITDDVLYERLHFPASEGEFLIIDREDAKLVSVMELPREEWVVDEKGKLDIDATLAKSK